MTSPDEIPHGARDDLLDLGVNVPSPRFVCECGYECRGESDSERIDDARQHARHVHGIDVTAEQVTAMTGTATDG